MSATQRSITNARIAAAAADDKLATDVIAFDVSEQIGIADVFLLCTGNTDRQVKAVVDEVEDRLREVDGRPLRREGEREGRWVLLDYGDLVVHVMAKDDREFYALERLWKDCPVVDLTGAVSGAAEQT
ncbi:MAG: ribosome silencing factor [Jiangellales bacterium]